MGDAESDSEERGRKETCGSERSGPVEEEKMLLK